MFKLIFIVEFFGLFNVFSLYIMQRGKSGAERLPFLVYQTCLNPWSTCTQNLFKTMPVTYSILTLAANACIIYFNIYLYTFLDKQSRENTGETFCKFIVNFLKYVIISALSPTDKRKARRRNLVSAKVGFTHLFFSSFMSLIVILLHFLPLEVGKRHWTFPLEYFTRIPFRAPELPDQYGGRPGALRGHATDSGLQLLCLGHQSQKNVPSIRPCLSRTLNLPGSSLS